jgi:hypothetical protein
MRLDKDGVTPVVALRNESKIIKQFDQVGVLFMTCVNEYAYTGVLGGISEGRLQEKLTDLSTANPFADFECANL